jgi:hypothetical protein
MADAQNPNGTGMPGQSGPARSGPGSVDPASASAILDAFNRTVPAVKAVVEQVDKIVEKMEKVNKSTEDGTKKVRSFGNELRQAMDFADSMEDTFKHLLDYQKKIAKEGLQAKSYEEVLKLFQEMEKESKKLAEEGVFSKKNTRIIQQNTEQIKKRIAELKAKMGEAFDPDVVSGLVSEFSKLNRLSLDIGKNMKSVRLSGLHADVEGARKSLLNLFQKPDRQQKYKDYAKTATGIREAKEHRDAGRTKEFNEMRAKLVDSSKGIRARYGKDKSFPEQANIAQQYATAKARKNGMGLIGSSIMGRSIRDHHMGRESGVLTRAGMGILARGEGSIGRGVGSMAMGALEGGAAGIAELAGPLAPVLAGLEVLKTFFNKNQEMNSQAAELGQSGIFSGKGSAIDNIHNVRQNLGGPIYSPIGIGFDKNLAIAKSLQDAGLSQSNLASDLRKDDQGFSKSGFGQVQQNVYMYGKVAGLDSSQTVTETIKLVGQYKQSLESTHDFFIRINKEAQTAGITTSKYIQVIDEVNSHYEKSNKLLEATVETMRLLSVTGRNTAEDLTDSMSAITNKGQQQDLPTSTFLNYQILNDKTASADYGKQLDSVADNALSNVQKAFGDSFDPKVWKEKLKNDRQGATQELRTIADQRFGKDSVEHQAADKALKGLRDAEQASDAFADAKGVGGMKGALMLSSSQGVTGSNVLTQVAQTMKAVEFSIKHGTGGKGSLDDFLSNPNMINENPAVQMMYTQQFHGTATDLNKASDIAGDAAAARTQMLAGASDKDIADPNSEMHKIAEATVTFLKGKYDLGKGDQVANLFAALKDPSKNAAITGQLSKSGAAYKDSMLNPELMKALTDKVSAQDEQDARDKTIGLNADTRTTADIYKDAFTALFGKLQTPLEKISRVIEFIGKSRWFGFKDDDPKTDAGHTMDKAGVLAMGAKAAAAQGYGDDSAGLSAQLDSRQSNGRVDFALTSYNNKVDRLRAQIKNPGAGDDVKDLTNQLNSTISDRDDLQRISDAEKSGQKGDLSDDEKRHARALTDNSPFSDRPILNASQVKDLFQNKLGVSGIGAHQSVNVSDDKWNAYNTRIAELPNDYKLGDVKDASGKVTGHTITNITNNSVAFNTTQDAKSSVQQAGETAKPSPSVPQAGQQ